MSPVSSSPPLGPADVARLRRFTVAQYRAMLTAGILYESEPVELLEGLVINKFRPLTPRECFPQHGFMRLNPRLEGVGWHVWFGTAITLPDSEPEPDVAILSGDENEYRTRFAVPSEVGAVVEFADASLAFDREVKGRIYARAGIPVYWIVNVIDRQVEVYTDPQPSASPPVYATRAVYLPGQDVPILLDGQAATAIPVADLLP